MLVNKSTSPDPGASPGRLENSVSMSIQTRQAQRLVEGRRRSKDKQQIIGLYQFAALTRRVWLGASKDDPYADWWLLNLEHTLAESRKEIIEIRGDIDHRIGGTSSLSVQLAQSIDPVQIKLDFSNPYGYKGAWLLGDMDQFALATLTARHVGLLNRCECERFMHQAGRAVRRVFSSVGGYHFLSVTRDDIAQGNQRAKQAQEAMGEISEAVIKGSVRAEYAPAISHLQAGAGN